MKGLESLNKTAADQLAELQSRRAADAAREAPLRPRAIAVLCALRCGPRSALQLMHQIGDLSRKETLFLLADMGGPFLALVTEQRQAWALAPKGIAWLESQGLSAAVRP